MSTPVYEDDSDRSPCCWCGGCGAAGDPCSMSDHEDKAYAYGAAVAFGIIGMAEAIQRNGPRIVERSYWTSEIDGRDYYTCHCPGCGVQLKRREPGMEGTSNEWCGMCRY